MGTARSITCLRDIKMCFQIRMREFFLYASIFTTLGCNVLIINSLIKQKTFLPPMRKHDITATSSRNSQIFLHPANGESHEWCHLKQEWLCLSGDSKSDNPRSHKSLRVPGAGEAQWESFGNIHHLLVTSLLYRYHPFPTVGSDFSVQEEPSCIIFSLDHYPRKNRIIQMYCHSL